MGFSFTPNSKAAQNNTDPASVLDAGWKAMQAADPGLATAIGKMPPQMAQNAVMQYTNAIRMGKEAEASAMAAEAVRAGFAATPAPSASPASPKPRSMFGGTGSAQPQYEIGDVDSFNKAIAPQAQAPRTGMNAWGGLSGRAVGTRTKEQQQAQQQNAFKGVKDAADNYEMSGYTDDEKKIYASYGVGLDPAKKKNLNTYTGWTPGGSADGTQDPSGLINNPYSRDSNGM